MSLYTTPLQFGYFFSLLMWLLLLYRGYRQSRLSDHLLGWIMFILAMELQDYTFGFAGINYLWNELNGFPRGVSFLFGPMVYFYFKAQVNRSFSLSRKDLWHAVPYLVYFTYGMFFFVQGPEAVQQNQAASYNMVVSYIMRIALVISFIYYLSQCLKIYHSYRLWSLNQFSNTELIDFKWFRNFLYAMIFWLLFREVMNVMSLFMELDFYQDWWWNLALVAVAFYIGMAGYAQRQPAKIHFDIESQPATFESTEKSPAKDQYSGLADKLTRIMNEERLFLQPELNLQELAQHLQTTPARLSATINQQFGQNFNDYINSLRVEAFIQQYQSNTKQHYTLLALALDSGFNSKATFNRAFKKIKGTSPKDYFQQ